MVARTNTQNSDNSLETKSAGQIKFRSTMLLTSCGSQIGTQYEKQTQYHH